MIIKDVFELTLTLSLTISLHLKKKFFIERKMTTTAVSSTAPDPSNVWQYEEYISKSSFATIIKNAINMSAHRVITSEID